MHPFKVGIPMLKHAIYEVVIDANYSIQLLHSGKSLQCDTTSHSPLLIPGRILFQHGIQTCSTRSGWSPWLQRGNRGLDRSLILHLASSCNDAKWTWIALARTTIFVLLYAQLLLERLSHGFQLVVGKGL